MCSRAQSQLVWLFALLVCVVPFVPARAQSPTSIPMATQDRLRNPGWWPTKGTPARSDYAGPDACAQCHALKAADQRTTPMAHASMPASNAEILHRRSPITFTTGLYTFAIQQNGNQASYSVTDGTKSHSQPLDWAFGMGEVGQTYVFNRNGAFYESKVSFYPGIQGLDLTLGHHPPMANDLDGALGRMMAGAEPRLCFGCHSTASTTSGKFDAGNLIPGVICEACHGPGAKHLLAMKQRQIKLGLQVIFNPARLNPVDAVDFCGACHRTTWDVALTNTVGVANVRFQPYRLEKSRCWGQGDSRLTCMACHDPHQPLARDPAKYDNQCLSCHVSSRGEAPAVSKNHPGKLCPVSSSKCVSCHMAKYEIPGSHAKFTDHWIRVVRSGAGYPD